MQPPSQDESPALPSSGADSVPLHSKHWLLTLGVAVAAYLAINWMFVWNILAGLSDRSVLTSAAQWLVLGIGFIALAFGAFAVRGIARTMFFVLALVSVTCNVVAYQLIGAAPDRRTGVWLFSELGQFTNLIGAWGGYVVAAAAIAAIPLGLLLLASGRLRLAVDAAWPAARARFFRTACVSAAIALPVTGGLLQSRVGLAESNVIAFGIVAARLGPQSIAGLAIEPAGPPLAEKIVLIMDESVRPDHFAALVKPAIGWPSIDFGTAYSSANCSAASNALMRQGIEPARVGKPHDPRSQPSIWAYARNARYTTVLMDGQLRKLGATQNFMSRSELELIDERTAHDVGIDSDFVMAGQLAQKLSRPGREMIYMVLRGSHTPYAANAPEDWRPPFAALPAGMKNFAYAASISYSTGRFFQRLAELHPKLDDTVLLYTSDHGQHHGGGNTHCRADSVEDSFEVPMLVIGGAKAAIEAAALSRQCWQGGANHQSLRTTLIETMGYSPAQLADNAFPSLLDCPQTRAFPRFHGALPFPSASGERLNIELLPFRAARAVPDGPVSKQ